MISRQPCVQITALKKKYGDLTVIENLNLDIQEGEFISLLGPSGSGKTTLLMILAGFEKSNGGKVCLDGVQIENTPAHKRGLGVVFQNYALFPHMSVAENISFPLKMRGVSKAVIKDKVQKALDMVQLSKYGDRKPSQLSGGQQQRIALARALIFEPRVVLMDEPFGALDKQLREQMQLDIRDMHRRLGLTVVFVTHDQVEALTMSDRVAVFNKGVIEHVAPPAEIYEKPKTEFVANFIGETNLLKGQVISVNNKTAKFLCSNMELIVLSNEKIQVGQKVTISLRPEKIYLSGDNIKEVNTLQVALKDQVYRGEYTRLDTSSDLGNLFIRVDRENIITNMNQKFQVFFKQDDCWVIPS